MDTCCLLFNHQFQKIAVPFLLYPICATFSPLKKTWECSVLSHNVFVHWQPRKTTKFHLCIVSLLEEIEQVTFVVSAFSLLKNQASNKLIIFSAF